MCRAGLISNSSGPASCAHSLPTAPNEMEQKQPEEEAGQQCARSSMTARCGSYRLDIHIKVPPGRAEQCYRGRRIAHEAAAIQRMDSRKPFDSARSQRSASRRSARHADANERPRAGCEEPGRAGEQHEAQRTKEKGGSVVAHGCVPGKAPLPQRPHPGPLPKGEGTGPYSSRSA